MLAAWQRTRTIARLEKRGLAKRYALHSAEERTTHLRLSDAAIALAAKLKREKAAK